MGASLGLAIQGKAVAALAATIAGATMTMATAAQIATTVVPAIVTTLEVQGCYATGDCPKFRLTRKTAQPAHTGYYQDALGAYFELTHPFVMPQFFGGGLNSPAYDDAAMQKAYSVAWARKINMQLTGTHRLTTLNYTIDPSVFRIIGDGRAIISLLPVTGATATSGTLFNVKFTNGVPNFAGQPWIEGCLIFGATGGVQNFALYGSTGSDLSGQAKFLKIRDCFLVGFTTHFTMGNNAFMCEWDNVLFTGWDGPSIVPGTGLTNSGENMFVTQCKWFGGVKLTAAGQSGASLGDFDTGFWFFDRGCSADYLPKLGTVGKGNTANATVYWFGYVEIDFTTGGGYQAAGGFWDYYTGNLHCEPHGIRLGGGCTQEFVKFNSASNGIGNVHFSCASVGFFNTWNGGIRALVNKDAATYATLTTGVVNFDNRPGVAQFYVVKSSGIMPLSSAGYTMTPGSGQTKGTMTDATDSIVAAGNAAGAAGYHQLKAPPSTTQIITGPIIPLNGKRPIEEKAVRATAISTDSGSKALFEWWLVDRFGAKIGTVPASVTFTSADVGTSFNTSNKNRVVGCNKVLAANQNDQVFGIQYAVTLTNASSTATMQVDAGFPNLQLV